eukprot:102070-Chlamydomonas_euryale.AAC.1
MRAASSRPSVTICPPGARRAAMPDAALGSLTSLVSKGGDACLPATTQRARRSASNAVDCRTAGRRRSAASTSASAASRSPPCTAAVAARAKARPSAAAEARACCRVARGG